MTPIEPYLAPARAFIKQSPGFFKDKNTDGLVRSVYNGYVSSFGVDVRQSGVLPALVLCLNTSGSATGDRKLVAQAIAYLLGHTDNANGLKDFVEETFRDKNKRRREVMNAAVALKLALRTFPMEKQENNL